MSEPRWRMSVRYIEQAPRRPDGGDLRVGQGPEFEVQRRERHVPAVLEGNDPGGAVVVSDIGEVDEGRELLVAGSRRGTTRL